MRENRTYGSEGRETGNTTGLPYPYQLYGHELLPPLRGSGVHHHQFLGLTPKATCFRRFATTEWRNFKKREGG